MQTTMAPDQTSQISEIAYKLWIEDGCPEGKDQEHWFRAEQIYNQQVQKEGNGEPVSSGSRSGTSAGGKTSPSRGRTPAKARK